MGRMGTMSTVSRWRNALVASVVALCTGSVLAAAPPAQATAGLRTDLYLVTLKGPGTAGLHGSARAQRAAMVARQDGVLARVDAGEPTYRWTTALDGVAVTLTAVQADALLDDPQVEMVEPNAVRRLAGHASTAGVRPTTGGRGGGAGEVVGVVDSGIWRQSPLFAPVGPHAGIRPGFGHACRGGEG